MKLAIIFEVPGGQADAYAHVASDLIQNHAFATEQKIEHWSFHQEMRPVAAVVIDADDAEGARMAAGYLNSRFSEPWIPGLAFRYHKGLKTVLLTILTALRGPHEQAVETFYGTDDPEDRELVRRRYRLGQG